MTKRIKIRTWAEFWVFLIILIFGTIHLITEINQFYLICKHYL